MATKQSLYCSKVTPITSPDRAGEKHEVIYAYPIPVGGLATTDIIELAALIPFGKIVSADLSDNGTLAVANLTVGLMTGNFGDNVAARTIATPIFTAVATGTQHAATVAQLAALPQNSDTPVSIGVTTSAALAAGGTIYLRLGYTINSY